MSDFFQTGAIVTLHRLGPTDLPRLERELPTTHDQRSP